MQRGLRHSSGWLVGHVAVLVLLGLVAASTVFRAWEASRVPSPWITPDEQTYALIGRSLYESGRFQVLGHDAGLLSLIYPALIGLPLHLLSPHDGYVTVKTLQAFVMSLTAVPVYLWGRGLAMRRGWALAAAGLTVAIPGLAYSGFLMTEVIFYPVVCLSAWAMARALADPTVENQAFLLAAMLLALATRLQAVVLVPILVLALLLKLGFERGRISSLKRFVPLFAGIAVVAVIWVLLTRGRGGGALGSYQVAGSTSYNLASAARFAVYHLADVLIMTAVVPVVALAILLFRAAAGDEASAAVRSFVAVATAYLVGFVAEVGLFTSSLLGRLGERYLLGLCPLLFLALACWLDRGAPRPVLATALASAGALGLLALLPMRFVSEAAAPDAFSLIPLYDIRKHVSASELKLGILAAALVLLLAFALTRPRFRLLLPIAVGALLFVGSLSASRFVAHQAAGFQSLTVGGDPRWIDRFAAGPVSFLYGGEYSFSKGGPVWANLFWNRKIDNVLTLRGAQVVGPITTHKARVAPDGGLFVGSTRVDTVSAVAPWSITFYGFMEGQGGPYVLWDLQRPARVSSIAAGIRLLSGDIDSHARMRVYGCGDGALELQLVAPEARTITLKRNGRTYRTIRLTADIPWTGRVPTPPGDASGSCTFELFSQGGGVHSSRFEFVRNE